MDAKKWYWLIAVPVLVGLSGCAGEVVGSSEEALAGPRPFSASFEGQLSFIGPFEPGSLDRCNANLFPEGEFPGHFISGFDTASGLGRHLGAFSLTSSFCVSFESPLSPQGEATFTAADGSEIFVTFENFLIPTEDPTVANVVGTQSIVGGSGRFEGASGDQDCEFVLSLVTFEIEGECSGDIVY